MLPTLSGGGGRGAEEGSGHSGAGMELSPPLDQWRLCQPPASTLPRARVHRDISGRGTAVRPA